MKRMVCAAVLVVLGVSVAQAGVADVANQVNQASYEHFIGQLFAHNGNDRQFFGGADRIPARNNIRSNFESFGLDTSYHNFTYSNLPGYNVIGKLEGRVNPSKIYLIGAHYDSTNHYDTGTDPGEVPGAPGADDNASGVAGVLEAARVLSQHAFDATIMFVAWDCEEPGLIGSRRYAADFPNQDYQFVISADMIGYNIPSNPNRARVWHQNSTGVSGAQQLALMFSTYGQGVTADTGRLPYEASDHAPFASLGYPAVAVSEAGVFNNPQYHEWSDSLDTPNHVDTAYATRITRTLTAFLADRAGLLTPGDATLDGVVDFSDLLALARNFASQNADWVDGDFDNDNVVGFSDVLTIATHYGPNTFADFTLALAVVPEPAAGLLLIGSMVGIRRR